MNLPADDYILLSLINTKLRDGFCSLEELCEEEGLDFGELCSRLNALGYFYDETANAFKAR